MDRTRIFEAAGKLAAKGQLDKAAKEYQRILDEDPKDVRALQKLAEIWQKTGRAKDAADLLLRVSEGYSEQGFFLKAVAVYKQILKLVPDRIDVNQRLAQLYQQLGLVGDATQQYQAVVNHYEKQGNTKESLAALRKMVELDPDNVASQVKLGEMYAREGLTAEALQELRKAAHHLKRNSRFDDFIRVLERMGQLAPDDPAVAKEVAEGFLGQGDARRALARLQICFRANPKDIATLELLARAFKALGQEGKTVSVFRELSSVHAERNDADAERDTLGRLLEIAPGDEEAILRLRELAQRHAPPAVIAMAPPPGSIPAAPTPEKPAPEKPVVPRKLSANISPTIARILTEADVYLKYGLVPKAAEHIQKAIAEDPASIDAREKLVAILDRQGKSEEALQELARLVELARAARDAERDSLFTQDLAQRAPDHPLVKAAAASAELPLASEDDIIVESDEGEIEILLDGSLVPPREEMVGPQVTTAAEVADSLWETAGDEEEEVIVDPEAEEDDMAPAEVSAAQAREPSPSAGVDPFAMDADHGGPVIPERTPSWLDKEPAATPSATVAMTSGRVGIDRHAQEISEAELLIQQGLFQPARDILEEILTDSPGHARASMLLQRLPPAGIHDPASIPPVSVPPLSVPPSIPPSVSPAAGASEGFNLGKELADELGALDLPPEPKAAPASMAPGLRGELAEFRKAIDATIGAEDSQTHYDLGIAYKEMGLLDEAIHAFEKALHAGGRRRVVDCLITIGNCHLEKGEPSTALPSFEKALKTPGLTLEAAKEAHFEIARCHELLGADRLALEHYTRVFKSDAAFRDVAPRLNRLRQLLKTNAPSSRPPVSLPRSLPPQNGKGSNRRVSYL